MIGQNSCQAIKLAEDAIFEKDETRIAQKHMLIVTTLLIKKTP